SGECAGTRDRISHAGGLGGVAGAASWAGGGGVGQASQEGVRAGRDRLRHRPRFGALFRLDRRAQEETGRAVLAATFQPAPSHQLSPRRPTSRWSQVNRDKVTRLIEAGRVRAPGLAEVERAKADGRWAAAYASPGKAVVPPDFRAALDAVPAAAESFGTLDSRNRFTMIYRVEDAKRPQTRAARIEKFVALLAEGKKLHL
ncbi:LOW QUALITY PROTEIN: conserved hypothetical protein, partial [Streptomyces sp. SPB074]